MTPVGLTSRWIAAARALETESRRPLFNDPLARELAGEAGFAMMDSMRASIGAANFSGPDPYLSIRTRFFDDVLVSAVTDAPVRQVVIVAAGMDARAFRLEWPEGVVLFEIDRADVFEYKEPVVERLGAHARCDRRIVRADVSADWVDRLVAAGFDREEPSAILVEGLLFYLEEATVPHVMRTIGELASEHSWLAMDFVNAEMLTSPFVASYMARLREVGCPWTFGVTDPEGFVSDYGWEGVVITPGEPDANYGRWTYPMIPRSVAGVPRSFLVKARKVAAGVTAARHRIVSPAPPVAITPCARRTWSARSRVRRAQGRFPPCSPWAGRMGAFRNISSICCFPKASRVWRSATSGWRERRPR
jgi:methyltransferase (TIGR00027 family)